VHPGDEVEGGTSFGRNRGAVGDGRQLIVARVEGLAPHACGIVPKPHVRAVVDRGEAIPDGVLQEAVDAVCQRDSLFADPITDRFLDGMGHGAVVFGQSALDHTGGQPLRKAALSEQTVEADPRQPGMEVGRDRRGIRTHACLLDPQ
jgi:hypothetical protein